MTWVRFDDGFPIHRKLGPLDDATYRLASEAIFWCSRNLTDGRIAADELESICRRATKDRAAKLVARGHWHAADFECPSDKCPKPGPDGWVIHDYLEYQFSKERVLADLAAKAERTRRWRDAKKNGKARDGTGDDAGDASRDASSDGASDASPSPTPSPPRRKAGDGGPPKRAPAAAGDGAAAVLETQGRSASCPRCANGLESAYHLRVCAVDALEDLVEDGAA
ncbi:MAG: hypothetical protein V4515_12620 [Chloroflexota bacterium]